MSAAKPDLSDERPIDFLRIALGMGTGMMCAVVLKSAGDGVLIYDVNSTALQARESTLERCDLEHVFERIDPPFHLDRLLILFRDKETATMFFEACASTAQSVCSFTAFEVQRGLTSACKYKYRKTRYDQVDVLCLGPGGMFCVGKQGENVVHFIGFGVASSVDLSEPVETADSLRERLLHPPQMPSIAVMLVEDFAREIVSPDANPRKLRAVALCRLCATASGRSVLPKPRFRPRCTKMERALTYINRIKANNAVCSTERLELHIANLREELRSYAGVAQYDEVNEKRRRVLCQLEDYHERARRDGA